MYYIILYIYIYLYIYISKVKVWAFVGMSCELFIDISWNEQRNL